VLGRMENTAQEESHLITLTVDAPLENKYMGKMNESTIDNHMFVKSHKKAVAHKMPVKHETSKFFTKLTGKTQKEQMDKHEENRAYQRRHGRAWND